MKKVITLLLSIFTIALIAACSTSVEEEDPETLTNIEIIKGDGMDKLASIADSLILSQFTIREVNRVVDTLKVDVVYSGGCLPHLFVFHWDEMIDDSDPDMPMTDIGLGHYLQEQDNCEALLTETLSLDLDELMGNQLTDDLVFNVINLADSTTTTYQP